MTSVLRRDDGIAVFLSREERSLLSGLLTSVSALLAPGAEASPDPLAAFVGMSDQPVEAPEDPALRRLLPDAYADAERAEEFRRLTDSDLRARKTEALDRVVADLAGDDPVVLDPDEGVGLWVQALNDVRLVIGTRLDVTEEWAEEFDKLPPDDPRLPVYLFYDWLSMMQDALVTAVMEA